MQGLSAILDTASPSKPHAWLSQLSLLVDRITCNLPPPAARSDCLREQLAAGRARLRDLKAAYRRAEAAVADLSGEARRPVWAPSPPRPKSEKREGAEGDAVLEHEHSDDSAAELRYGKRARNAANASGGQPASGRVKLKSAAGGGLLDATAAQRLPHRRAKAAGIHRRRNGTAALREPRRHWLSCSCCAARGKCESQANENAASRAQHSKLRGV